LDKLNGLLERVREFSALKEKSRGSFYKKSSAMLHFHEDPAGLFADLKVGSDWARFPVNTQTERRRLLAKLSSLI
ncbi:MAG TPA: hypothetical protein VJX67_21680, partial [Blastocatellia bacterium]|nr:hypothetical protein [Blastocatellia bacterium]